MSTAIKQPRKNLFRRIALERFRGQMVRPSPLTLPIWRNGLIAAAIVSVLVAALIWLVP